MFKHSKKLNPPPKPITVEQVLSDLETFAVPKKETVPTRYISPNDPDIENEWWKLFETFIEDVDHLKRIQDSLDTTKDRLTEKRKETNQVVNKLDEEMKNLKDFIDKIEME